jgi:serine/threonine protein kinase
MGVDAIGSGALGTVISGYRVLETLGDGRTATVYLAEDAQGRRVALKVPKTEVLNDPQLGYMFRNEVGLSRALKHPHIVPTFGGEAGGDQPYLAMRYYSAGTLAECEPDQPVALRILADVAAVLHYLHSQNLVHQDVKPANIFPDGGRGFLSDFGATMSEAQTSRAAGSPFYMAPELYSGGRNTTRSDVYALGVVAFEILTGERPFQGGTYEELRGAHLVQLPPSVRGRCRGLPREAANVIDAALRKDEHARPTAVQFKEGLEAAIKAIAAGTPTTDHQTDAPQGGRLAANAVRAKEEPSLWARLLKRKG